MAGEPGSLFMKLDPGCGAVENQIRGPISDGTWFGNRRFHAADPQAIVTRPTTPSNGSSSGEADRRGRPQ
jgi:hypothetical protein